MRGCHPGNPRIAISLVGPDGRNAYRPHFQSGCATGYSTMSKPVQTTIKIRGTAIPRQLDQHGGCTHPAKTPTPAGGLLRDLQAVKRAQKSGVYHSYDQIRRELRP